MSHTADANNDDDDNIGKVIHVLLLLVAGEIKIIKNVHNSLTLKKPVTTAADDIHKYFFIVFQRK